MIHNESKHVAGIFFIELMSEESQLISKSPLVLDRSHSVVLHNEKVIHSIKHNIY